MNPSTSLMIGMAPSLIRRVSSSAMPVLALPWRMAAYMLSSFRRLLRRQRIGVGAGGPNATPTPAVAPSPGGGWRNLLSNLIWRKSDRPVAGHTAAFLPLEHDLPAATGGRPFLARMPEPSGLLGR